MLTNESKCINTDPKINIGISGLSYLYTNADQLLNKIEDLKMVIAQEEPDVMMISEVIPKAQKNPIAVTLIGLEGYGIVHELQIRRH